jgi:hypothetical protein
VIDDEALRVAYNNFLNNPNRKRFDDIVKPLLRQAWREGNEDAEQAPNPYDEKARQVLLSAMREISIELEDNDLDSIFSRLKREGYEVTKVGAT